MVRFWNADVRSARFFVDSQESLGNFQEIDAESRLKKFLVDISGEIRMIPPRVKPTLVDLCVKSLAENIDRVTSLDGVPDFLRSRISSHVYRSGKIDSTFVKLLAKGSPEELIAKDCSSLDDKDWKTISSTCNGDRLQVLILYFCGLSCPSTLFSSSPNGLPELTSLSLRGAFRLTDDALDLISQSAPSLQLVDLSDCSMLTGHAVEILSSYFRDTLRGLNIEGCQGIIDISQVLGSLKMFRCLKSLSVAGFESIVDSVVVALLEACGSNLTGLSLARCRLISDVSISAIVSYCPRISELDVSGLSLLTNQTLQGLAICGSLSILKLERNKHFGDEALATFIQARGPSLQQLSLNSIRMVGPCTTASLATCCQKMWFLDLSWCRQVTGEQVRKILVGCPSLRQLRGFGLQEVFKNALK